MSTPPIGFVGLGVMGLPMAVNLSRAGYSLTVYDRDPAAAEKAAGAIAGVKVAAIARGCGPGVDHRGDHAAFRQTRARGGAG